MNYLAHVFLAENSFESQLGNLLGDFVRPADDHLFSEQVQSGIRMHRKVDSFTDSHPIFRSAKRLISKDRERFSGIMVDVFFDHLLIRFWTQYAKMSLHQFLSSFNAKLARFADTCKHDCASKLKYISQHNVLASCKTTTGVERTLKSIDRRIRRQTNLISGGLELTRSINEFTTIFHDFMPELISYSSNFHESHSANEVQSRICHENHYRSNTGE